MNKERQVQGIKAEFDAMLRRLPKNLDPQLVAKTISQQIEGERISIEFWDPSKKMNRCIIDRADRLTYQQLAVIADYQRELGRTELKIRRAGQFRPCNPECKFWKFPNLDRACVLSEVFSVLKGEPCYEFKKKEKGE